MKIEAGRLMEAFANPGWEADEKSGLLEFFNVDKSRRLFFISREVGGGKTDTSIGLSFFDESRGWVDIFEVSLLETALNLSITHIMARGLLDEVKDVEARVLFGYLAQKSVIEYSFPFEDLPSPSRRAIQDAAELIYKKQDMSIELDCEATLVLFIEQMVKGEMTRPVLVPLEANI